MARAIGPELTMLIEEVLDNSTLLNQQCIFIARTLVKEMKKKYSIQRKYERSDRR